MSEQATAQELLEQIKSFLTMTRSHLGEGGDVDLEGLDSKVQELCEHVLDMPLPEAEVYRKELAALAQELNTLKADMEQAQYEVREQIGALNARHKAARAYKTGEAMKPKTPKNEG
jgi:DNA anti-recombination protein RmuC